jgi:hypothetical protein
MHRCRSSSGTRRSGCERLRDEHGYGGGYTTVRDYVRVRRWHRREVFVPLWHPVGHGRAGFGEAVAVIGAMAQKVICS